MTRPRFTTDDIALAIEIPGYYDGTSVYLLKDGTLVNRFAGQSGWRNLPDLVDAWIAKYGNAIRERNHDLLDREETK